jgi:hypothetical protein
MRRFAISQIYVSNHEMVKISCDEKRDLIAITHANLTILGASGKEFSIGAKADTTDVQITIFVCFVIH